MEPYIYLEHTADAKFQAFGETLEQAFSNAALAMFNVMLKTEDVKPKITKKINVNAKDIKALLYSWLEEFLFLMDSEMFLLNKIEKIKIEKNESTGKYSLVATISGDKASEKYKTHGEVKAVTYNEMEVQDIPGNCMVQVVVDI